MAISFIGLYGKYMPKKQKSTFDVVKTASK